MHVILEAEVVAAVATVEEGCGVDWESVMGRCFEKMDDEVASRGGPERRNQVAQGSTAVVVVVGKEEIVVGNCDDSRAGWRARIEAVGGRVINYNGARVMGVLATSRSIGDHYLRPYVIPQPEVDVYRRTSDDEFLILATDGLWDVTSDQEACQLAKKCLCGGNNGAAIGFHNRASSAVALLAQLAIAKRSNDNIIVIVSVLRKSKV